MPPPNCNDPGVFPLNGIRLYENVGNGLAHSVGEAALETVPIFEFGGLFIITSLWETACGEKAADAVGMSKPIPYGHTGTFSVQRNMDGNPPFGTDKSVPYAHAEQCRFARSIRGRG